MSSDLNNITSTLDATDLQLLAALQADASISNIALADKLHLSAATCLRLPSFLHLFFSGV